MVWRGTKGSPGTAISTMALCNRSQGGSWEGPCARVQRPALQHLLYAPRYTNHHCKDGQLIGT